MTSMADLKQVTFAPDVLERIAPDVSLQRHLALGIRPNLRNFNEFKSIEYGNSSQLQQNSDNVFASSILKSGSTTVINTISLSIVEDLKGNGNSGNQQSNQYASIYPQVEILRGRSGAPTDEEMILSQNLYESFRNCRIIPAIGLKIDNLGLAVKDERTGEEQVLYPDLHESQWQYINLSSMHNKQFSFVLHSNIKIFSRQVSTNSLFDLCFASCLKALQDLKLPRCYVDDSVTTKISIRSRKSSARGTVDADKGNLTLDSRQEMLFNLQLNVPNATVSSNFGVIKEDKKDGKTILLADLEGEAEESSVLSRISIICNDKETINKISLVSDGAINLDVLKQAIEMSKKRAEFQSSNAIE
ncbi:hypothetical protein KGF56_004451 [Candida oxycetoniae]|uniref:Ribosomal RNA-processing protein 43 n=1 Tax=Candida oxycetoniae TaxID=497107 RepID=A0AAI9STK2_9ASCO|nr:uncharacterized protein KGF56_004451 [Candida oxycetoniae]KAI3402777.2 hypothetical protein KGF56_004451 [Candida oxycetoniae]